MSDKDQQSLDVLGIKPVGEAFNTVVKGSVEGASAFLSRICLPAAEEFGLLLRDKVSHWRTQNLIRIAERAEKKLNEAANSEDKHAHPRLVSMALENGSWSDSDEVQEMWGGLLASACTENGKDDSNLLFMNLLSQLTHAQVSILNYGCEKAQKYKMQAGWIAARKVVISVEDLTRISGVDDFHRLDRELDYLRALELIDGGFKPNSTDADISPTSLALHLYVRCQGSLKSPLDYFGLTDLTPPKNNLEHP